MSVDLNAKIRFVGPRHKDPCWLACAQESLLAGLHIWIFVDGLQNRDACERASTQGSVLADLNVLRRHGCQTVLYVMFGARVDARPFCI